MKNRVKNPSLAHTGVRHVAEVGPGGGDSPGFLGRNGAGTGKPGGPQPGQSTPYRQPQAALRPETARHWACSTAPCGR